MNDYLLQSGYDTLYSWDDLFLVLVCCYTLSLVVRRRCRCRCCLATVSCLLTTAVDRLVALLLLSTSG